MACNGAAPASQSSDLAEEAVLIDVGRMGPFDVTEEEDPVTFWYNGTWQPYEIQEAGGRRWLWPTQLLPPNADLVVGNKMYLTRANPLRATDASGRRVLYENDAQGRALEARQCAEPTARTFADCTVVNRQVYRWEGNQIEPAVHENWEQGVLVSRRHREGNVYYDGERAEAVRYRTLGGIEARYAVGIQGSVIGEDGKPNTGDDVATSCASVGIFLGTKRAAFSATPVNAMQLCERMEEGVPDPAHWTYSADLVVRRVFDRDGLEMEREEFVFDGAGDIAQVRYFLYEALRVTSYYSLSDF